MTHNNVTMRKRVRVLAMDVNDSPPMFQKGKGLQHKTDSIIIKPGEKEVVR